MTARPLHRWKTFWLGILILTFICWGWHRSLRQYDAIFANVGTTQYVISNFAGYANARKLDFIDGRKSTPPFGFAHRPASTTQRSFPAPFGHRAIRFRSTIESSYNVAHWLITLIFLISWSNPPPLASPPPPP